MINVGIVGAGTIVPDFLLAASQISEINVIAISGTKVDMEKMNEFSQSYNISCVYDNYEDMLENSQIDTVYVAVPNVLHYSFTKKALNKNKNVICEKPFVVKKVEAIKLAELAKSKHLYLFDAMPNQFFPNYLKVKELIDKLGDIKIVQINYSQYSRRYDQFKAGEILPVFDPTKAGGALLDLGVYNVQFVLGLFGMPKKINYNANVEKGVDTSGILTMIYDSMQCVCIAAKDCKAPLTINIQGDKGYIHSDSPANIFSTFEFGDNSGNVEKFELNEKTPQERLYHELNKFNEIIKNEDYDYMLNKLEQAVNVVDVLEIARKDAGLNY